LDEGKIMGVIINEFEMIVDGERQQTQPAEQPVPEKALEKSISPRDVAAILEHECQRQLRLLAH